MSFEPADVVVIGAGNAALTAALSAYELGSRVIVLEAAPEEKFGGNSRYTFGCFRVGFSGAYQICEIFPDISQSDYEILSNSLYTSDDFYRDLMRASSNLADKDLCRQLADQSYSTVLWMQKQGVRWEIPFESHSAKLGRGNLWSMMPGVAAKNEGRGLVDMLVAALEKNNIPIYYNTRAENLLVNQAGHIEGVRVKTLTGYEEIPTANVILACGGFEANTMMRSEYLGPTWATMKVRGTRYNMGAGLKMALAVGAQPYGYWPGAHAVPVDADSDAWGDLALGERTRRCLFQQGIMVNQHGKRFMDEGENEMVLMYAKVGSAVQEQPDGKAFQIFDSKWLEAPIEPDFYFLGTSIQADSIKELADKLGIPMVALEDEVAAYNEAIDEGTPYNPYKPDGRSARNIIPPRSNFARKIDQPPFWAFQVTGGITFTYGGIKINTNSQVLDISDQVIPGLFAAGELTGGYFYYTYPGAAGLTRGAVTGFAAGRSASKG